jgi:hypothetical protein
LRPAIINLEVAGHVGQLGDREQRVRSGKGNPVSDDSSSLNDLERKVRNFLRARLAAQATITGVKQTGNKIKIEVVSPFEFVWTANALQEFSGEVAKVSHCALDVQLSTFWPAG